MDHSAGMCVNNHSRLSAKPVSCACFRSFCTWFLSVCFATLLYQFILRYVIFTLYLYGTNVEVWIWRRMLPNSPSGYLLSPQLKVRESLRQPGREVWRGQGVGSVGKTIQNVKVKRGSNGRAEAAKKLCTQPEYSVGVFHIFLFHHSIFCRKFLSCFTLNFTGSLQAKF